MDCWDKAARVSSGNTQTGGMPLKGGRPASLSVAIFAAGRHSVIYLMELSSGCRGGIEIRWTY